MKIINLFLFILITSSLYSQSKICHTNIDFGIGIFVFSYELTGLSIGPTLNVNNGFKINKNRISVNILYGGWGIIAEEGQGPFNFSGPSEVKLFKIDALYGVQLKVLFKKIIIEPSVGIGFYGQRIEVYTDPILESTINFPLRM